MAQGYLDSLSMGGGIDPEVLAEMERMLQEQQGNVIEDALSNEPVATAGDGPAYEGPSGYEEDTGDLNRGGGGVRATEAYRTPKLPNAPGSPDAAVAMPAGGAPSQPTPSMPDAPSPISAESQAPSFAGELSAAPPFSSQLRVGGAGGGAGLAGSAGGLLGGGLQAAGPDMGEDDPSSLLASLLALLGQGGGQEL